MSIRTPCSFSKTPITATLTSWSDCAGNWICRFLKDVQERNLDSVLIQPDTKLFVPQVVRGHFLVMVKFVLHQTFVNCLSR